MVSPPLQISSLAQPPESLVLGATAALLKDTVCRLPAAILRSPSAVLAPEVADALEQLTGLVMALRSPAGGWPANLEQTPENLAPYVSEETGELLDALDQAELPMAPDGPPILVAVPALVPHLLWMLASSGYEVMRLVEGVRARIYHSDTEFSLRVLRLVPVLHLATADDNVYQLDLVTQTDPVPHHYLDESTLIQLVDNDLDDQPCPSAHFRNQLIQLIAQVKPELFELLESGVVVDALCPFQPWRDGKLKLSLYLADMDNRPTTIEASPLARESVAVTTEAEPEGRFTLDDFASTLADDALPPTTGVFGDWLTFTDESWVQTFLFSNAQQVIARRLLRMVRGPQADVADRELAYVKVIHEATTLVQGPSSLGKHTFVHEPLLVADLWPRLQWYLAQSSEQVMQLMGGLAVRVMTPARGWQTGTLYLRPLLVLAIEERTWIIDLSTGRLLPTYPAAVADTAVIDAEDDCHWPSPLVLSELAARITQDFEQQAPAITALQTGTSIAVHQLEAAAGRLNGTLSIDWLFTLQHGA
jgi:hypothetical protein